MPSDSEIILKASGIHKSYTLGKKQQKVLKGVDLNVKKGEFLAIMGASGSGKSTLLHILGLLDKPDNGNVHFENQDVFTMASSKQDHYARIPFEIEEHQKNKGHHHECRTPTQVTKDIRRTQQEGQADRCYGITKGCAGNEKIAFFRIEAAAPRRRPSRS